MSAYLQELNTIQRAAAMALEGPVLVVAGPGSGKTRVLTYRIAYLIEQGAAPWEILALTFTNKAAKSMKERIAAVIGGRANSVWAGTFHSIFARILRTEAEYLGYPSNFTIYDTDDAKSLLRNIIKEMGLSKDVYAEGAILQRISSAKSNLISPVGYAKNEQLLAEDKGAKRPFIYQIYQKYSDRCKKAGAMDFDDLLFQMFILLYKHEDVRRKYQQKFKYLLVDEFQDTNFLQYAIVQKLIKYEGSPENVCVVGDDAQSIYAFRGATIDNILNFEKDFNNLRTYKLEQNYRSTHHIVQAANEVIGNNAKQIKKEIWTDKTEGSQKIKVIKSMTDAEEAKRVADIILEHKNRYHVKNKEVAILYRTNAQSRPFEEALRRANLPYRVFGGMSFYARKEVKDLICYLRLVVNQSDEEALRRIINYPTRGIGDSLMEKIVTQANATNQSLWQTVQTFQGTTRENTSLQGFTAMMKTFINREKTANAYEIAQYVYRQSGIQEKLKSDSSLEGKERQDNTAALLDAISEFVDNDEIIDEAILPEKTLSTYLQNIALVTDADNANKDADVVTLMSVHSAKGLEFGSVIVAGLEEDLFPSFMSKDSGDGIDEERRLFYVAITRAEKYLTLTYAASRYRFGQMKYMEASRFLDEISQQHTEVLGGGNLARNNGTEKARVSIGTAQRPSAIIAAKRAAEANIQVNAADFKPSPSESIKAGQKVLHLKFGEGMVVSVEGADDNRVATIDFKELSDERRKIMLKFAKLQILG